MKKKIDRRKTRLRSDLKIGNIMTYRKGWFVPLCKKYLAEGYLPMYIYTGKNTRLYKTALEDWSSLSFQKEGLRSKYNIGTLDKTKEKIDKDIKQAKSVTEAMILAEASGYNREQLGKTFVRKVKQIRRRTIK